MRGVIKKDKIIIGVSIVVLCFALIQLGVLVYHRYTTSEKTKREVKLTVEKIENGTVKVMQGEEELLPNDNNEFYIKEGENISIKCTPDEEYGVYSVKLGEENLNVENAKEFTYEDTIKENQVLQIDLKRQYCVSYINRGKGSCECTYGENKINEKQWFFEGEKIELSFIPELYYAIKHIEINGESVNVEENNKSFSYAIPIMNKDYNIEVECYKPIYSVKITGGELKVWINGKETNEAKIESGSKCEIKIEGKRKNIFIVGARDKINERIIEDAIEKASYYIYDEKLMNDIDIQFRTIEFGFVEGKFEECFDIFTEKGDVYRAKPFGKDNIIVYLNKNEVFTLKPKKNIKLSVFIDGAEKEVNGLSIKENCSYNRLGLEGKCGIGVYKPNLQFIFDTTPPQVSSYNTKKSSADTLSLIATIKDQGDAGIDTVQFGTKEDYDAKKTVEETEKSYQYKANAESNDQYIFELPKDGLEKKEYYIWATDRATNQSEAVKVDITGPELTVDTQSEWTNRDITVTGKVVDESKVSQIYYSTSKEDAGKHTVEQKSSKQCKMASYDQETGNYNFVIEANSSGKSTYYVWGYDEVGNKSEKIISYTALVDIKKPTVSLVKKTPNKKWTNSLVTMEFKASDAEAAEHSGITEVYYYDSEHEKEPTKLVVNKAEKDSYVIQSPKDQKGNPVQMEGYYNIYAKDKAGNVSEPLVVEVNIDTCAPKAAGITVRQDEDEGETLKGMTHGMYSNTPVLIEVLGNDRYQLSDGSMVKSSGLSAIALLCNEKEIGRQKITQDCTEETQSAKFKLPAPFKGTLSVVLYDVVGNQTKLIPISKIDSSYHDDICIETGKPSIGLDGGDDYYVDENKNIWYGKDQELTVTYKDTESGLAAAEIKINGQAIKKDAAGKSVKIGDSKKIAKESFVINTNQIGESSDGKYTIELRTCDNAGNEKTSEKTLYIDRGEPKIEQFSFIADGVKDQSERLIEKQEYGYYFNGNTKVTIKASDGDPSSGVHAIEYYMVDYSKDKSGVETKKVVKEAEKDNTVSFMIQNNFKGQVFARAIDCVAHTTESYSKPYGIIIDSSAKKNSKSEITFTTPDTKKKDEKGNLLYKENVDVGIDVANTFKGIRSVEWEVSSKQDSAKNQSGKVTVSADGKLQGDRGMFSINGTDVNLVTSLKGALKITNNSNDIRVHVVVTDRSGIESEKELYISIDKTKPTVQISFDKQKEGIYYNENRMATIRVKDRNFSPEKLNLEVFNADGMVPTLSEWSKTKNEKNPDETLYTATVLFDKDGIYSLAVSLEDSAGNKARSEKTEVFTIDKEKPVCQIDMPQSESRSAGIEYYNSDIMVRLHVNEKNFDYKKIQVKGTAKKDGKILSYPELQIVSSTKIDHNLAMEFTEEGEYTLQIAYTDEAGNQAEEKELVKFVIDKTVPEVSIVGVEDSKAYNGDIMPVITCKDGNMQSSGGKVQLYDALENEIEITPAIVREQKVYQYTLNCFPKEEKYDNVYKLYVECEDLAKNKTKKQIYFSLNRFGSTYSFNDSLLSVAGRYVNNDVTPTVKEVNVNKLQEEDTVVRLICNDNVKDLVKEQDYTVKESGGNGSWYTYEYEISKELIKEDGKYSIAIYSKDEAGNINENIDGDKKAELWFGIDRTAPRIVPINISSGATYNQEERKVLINVEDNLLLGSTKIFVNGEEQNFSIEDNQYAVQVGSSNSEQVIKVVATDLAGNESVKEIGKFYITKNLLIRIANNKAFLFLVIGGIALVAVVSVVGVIKYRRKREY